jgi:hypothetical protein
MPVDSGSPSRNRSRDLAAAFGDIYQIVLVTAYGFGFAGDDVLESFAEVDEEAEEIFVVGEGALGVGIDEFCVVGEAAFVFVFLVVGEGYRYRVEVHHLSFSVQIQRTGIVFRIGGQKFMGKGVFFVLLQERIRNSRDYRVRREFFGFRR